MRPTQITSPVALYLPELAEGSRRTMRYALAQTAEFFGGGAPTRSAGTRSTSIRSARCAQISPPLAPHTANEVLAAVPGVL